MTYEKAIERLSQKVRDKEAWPDDSSKQSEQLHLLYNAALAVLRSNPLSRHSLTDSEALTETESGWTDLNVYAFPDDLFRLRADYGISHYLFDDKVFMPYQADPITSVQHLSDSNLYKTEVLFAHDFDADRLYVKGADAVKIHYSKQPAKPTEVSAEFPVPDDNELEMALSIVAAHVSGETIRDQAAISHQAFLTQLYGDPDVQSD